MVEDQWGRNSTIRWPRDAIRRSEIQRVESNWEGAWGQLTSDRGRRPDASGRWWNKGLARVGIQEERRGENWLIVWLFSLPWLGGQTEQARTVKRLKSERCDRWISFWENKASGGRKQGRNPINRRWIGWVVWPRVKLITVNEMDENRWWWMIWVKMDENEWPRRKWVKSVFFYLPKNWHSCVEARTVLY